MLCNISAQGSAASGGGIKRFSVTGFTGFHAILNGNYTEDPALFASGHSYYIKDASGGNQTCIWQSGGPTWLLNDDITSVARSSTPGPASNGEPWAAPWPSGVYGTPIVTQI